MCFQNLIDTGQLKPLRFHLEGVRRGGVRGWEQDEGGHRGDEEMERSEVKRGGGECSMKTQE